MAALGLLLVSSGLAVLFGNPSANASHEPGVPSDKAFVCKYVGKPGVDEVAQTVIQVDMSSVAGHAVGAPFNDEQGRSVVIKINVHANEPNPPLSDCPPLTPPLTDVTAAVNFSDCPADADPVARQGVVYNITAGSVANGASVTFTASDASASDNFRLVGQTVFTHTFKTDAQCNPPKPPPHDECPNIPGNQPEGFECDQTNPPPAPPQAAPQERAAAPVTPSVIRAGLVSAPAAPDHGPLGTGLVAAGLVLLMGAGARSLARAGGR